MNDLNVDAAKEKAKKLLDEGFPAKMKQLLGAQSWCFLPFVPIHELNNKVGELFGGMMQFYYPLIMWVSLLRPQEQAVESLQLHIQQKALSMLADCEHGVRVAFNDISEFYFQYGKAEKRLSKHPTNKGYQEVFNRIYTARYHAVLTALVDALHNLMMIDSFFKKNLCNLENDNSNNQLFN